MSKQPTKADLAYAKFVAGKTRARMEYIYHMRDIADDERRARERVENKPGEGDLDPDDPDAAFREDFRQAWDGD